MRSYSGVVLCVLCAFAAYLLSAVDTTPLPPRFREDGELSGDPNAAAEMKLSFSEGNLRAKRGAPCCRVDDSDDYEWETGKSCGCDPCDAIRDATEARMLRMQHRKIVAEMKRNRLKRKLHNAVCPSCALAHERQIEPKPCTKPHVDITVVVPGANPQETLDEYPMLPPPRETYSQVIQTASTLTSAEPVYEQPMEPEYEPMVPEPQYIPEYLPMRPEPQYRPMRPEPQYGPMRPEPQYGPMRPEPQYGPMRPEPQYGPMWPEPQYGSMRPEPQYGPMRPEPQYGPMRPQRRPLLEAEPVPWMRSAVGLDSKEATKENLDEDFERKYQRAGLLRNVSEKRMSTTETPNDSEDARPWKNATYSKVSIHFLSPGNTSTGNTSNDSGEAVPFNYTGSLSSPRRVSATEDTNDSGDAVPFNYTGSFTSPRRVFAKDETNDSGEAVPFNYTGSLSSLRKVSAKEDTNESGEAVPFNYTSLFFPMPRVATEQLNAGGASPFNYTGPLHRVPVPVAKDETSLRAPPIDEIIWQTAFNAASKAAASMTNNSSASSTGRLSCSGGQCKCSSDECLENEVSDDNVGLRLPPPPSVRGKRSTSLGMPIASALLTGLVSAIIGA